MTEAVVTIIVGFFLGMVGSYLVWLVTVRTYVPKIVVSQIARNTVSTNPLIYEYRIKVFNQGRKSVSGLSITCKIFIQGINRSRPKNIISLYLPVADENPFPVLEAHSGRVYTLRISGIRGGRHKGLPEGVCNGLVSGEVSLEELLQLSEVSYLRLAVTGSHEVGGLQRTIDRKYIISDIIEGEFKQSNTVNIVNSEI